MSTKGVSSYVQTVSRIELQQLRYFLAVADKLNFSRAADELYVSQSLLSQQISNLETELGTKLLERNTKAVSLTPNGAVFLTEVRRILDRIDDAIQAASFAEKKKERPIQIQLACDELFDRAALANGSFRLMAEHPNVLCFIRIEPYYMIMESLENRACDLGITFSTSDNPQISEKLPSSVLGEDWVDLILPKHAEFTHLPFFEQIDMIPLLLPERDSRLLNIATQVCSDLRHTPKIVFNYSLQDIIIAVELGRGFTLLPHRIAQQYLNRSVRIVSLRQHSALRLNYTAHWVGKTSPTNVDIASYFKMN